MKQFAVFDLDGTLTDTLPTISHYVNAALCEVLGDGCPPIPPDAFRYMVGNGAALLCRRALARVGLPEAEAEAVFPRFFRTYNRLYDAEPLYLTRPYPGIVPAVEALRARGVTVAVLSNKPEYAAREVVRRLFGDAFSHVAGNVPGRSLKPAPDGLSALMQAAGAAPADTVMIGDSAVDVATGKAAGVFCVGVTWGFREEEELRRAGADCLAHTPAELTALF